MVNSMKWAILSALIVGTVAFAIAKDQVAGHKSHVLRGPASKAAHVQGKASGLFDVEIIPASAPVSQAGQTFALDASITAKHDVEDVQFAWNLPEGISASSAIKGSLGPMKAGEVKHLSLTAVSGTAENRRIHLHVYKQHGREAMGMMSQYNTVDEEKIEQKIRTKAEILQSNSASGGQRLKVVQ